MNANVYAEKDYKNETAHRPKKTNPNKPNQTFDGLMPVFEGVIEGILRLWSVTQSRLPSPVCMTFYPVISTCEYEPQYLPNPSTGQRALVGPFVRSDMGKGSSA